MTKPEPPKRRVRQAAERLFGRWRSPRRTKGDAKPRSADSGKHVRGAPKRAGPASPPRAAAASPSLRRPSDRRSHRPRDGPVRPSLRAANRVRRGPKTARSGARRRGRGSRLGRNHRRRRGGHPRREAPEPRRRRGSKAPARVSGIRSRAGDATVSRLGVRRSDDLRRAGATWPPSGVAPTRRTSPGWPRWWRTTSSWPSSRSLSWSCSFRAGPPEPQRRGERDQRPPAPLPGGRADHAQGHLDHIRDSSTTIGLAAAIGALWIGTSFWGAMDTSFCRIYHVSVAAGSSRSASPS